jgi:hypothetical protein
MWSESYQPLSEREGSAAAEALFETARPLFAGQHPQVVGVALAQLTALWLAGHQAPDEPERIDEFRRRLMEIQAVAALELTPLMEAEFVKPKMAARR